MRFKKGSEVEVFSNREVPSGAWRIAEIISGNGHYYKVRYGSYACIASDGERVPRKSIRPLPPPGEVVKCWAPGDIVEVFENSSWKMAAVSKILARDCFLVRLLGSSLEFRATQFDIRVRQSWQNDGWITIGQGSKGVNEGQHDQSLSIKCKARLSTQSHVRNSRKKLNLKGDVITLESKGELDDFDVLSSKGLKRKPYSLVEPHGLRTAQKIRAVEKGCRPNRPLAAAYPSTFLEKVDDNTLFPGKTIHEKYNIGSTENRTGSFADVAESLLAKGVEEEEEETESIASSVGSCSIGSYSFVPIEDINENTSSDAESVCGSESHRRKTIRPGKHSEGELHRLELDAYRCTIERLHASGPITWEQEVWITNLRAALNISNDEHLVQIRNLVSADNSTVYR
ncbi:PREDICTED: uncharacterized protein LOC104811043 [Tarenaya hassleriana]|uniref:uncharacterized protein LOC104811043 n=1 Tax=Tarenaya hassleriana TaxID=28532 RepID=UPI00053C369F|nr:PREDICTED: uncharacterized protein LOC104811043 [Tarenaya hassleriana]XP_010535877.1 PREDICTED: uncharacterized protein LOC104811043 [Tarenaya hassleriana]XP_010535878.1 PREDICTED: uncharacterized protein LOC104811043 [Tarenaya hassleriana]XP_010535880.1 PREDICTED: uncharacterized protein LOC104811043 [Tarenaya hassleriana]